MEPDKDELELPDDWQLEGFDDETTEWWLANDFDCAAAVIWRSAYFDPETAAAWVFVGVEVEEAAAWRAVLAPTEYDIVDAVRFWAEGLTPEELPRHFAELEREREEAGFDD
jgi:hypothetical protein